MSESLELRIDRLRETSRALWQVLEGDDDEALERTVRARQEAIDALTGTQLTEAARGAVEEILAGDARAGEGARERLAAVRSELADLRRGRQAARSLRGRAPARFVSERA